MKTFGHLCTCLFAALLAACSGGEDHADERRAAVARDLDATATATLAQNGTWPGIAAHVIVDAAGLTWRTGIGLADVDAQRPLTADATFRTASITKTFTAASIYRLAELNHLDVGDAIESHLQPSTSALLRTAGYDPSRITIDHLLAHISGVRDFATSPEFMTAVLADPTRAWSRIDEMAFALGLGGPLAAPGEGYVYSDTATLMRALVQGRIISHASLDRMQTVSFAQPAISPARGLFRVRVGGQDCWGHDGFWGAVAMHCPETGVTVGATINTSPFGLTPGSDLDQFGLAAKLVTAANDH